MGLTMLFHAQLPKHFWVDAFMTVVYLINRLPFSVLKMETPFFKLHGTLPNYNSLKVFGCRCFPYLRDYAKNKFTPKSYSCVFLGYSPMHKGYRCLPPPSKGVYLSRHVIFYETIFSYANPTSLFSPAQQSSVFSTFTELAGGFFKPSSVGLSDANPSQASSETQAHIDASHVPLPTCRAQPSITSFDNPCSRSTNAQAQITSAVPNIEDLAILDPVSNIEGSSRLDSCRRQELAHTQTEVDITAISPTDRPASQLVGSTAIEAPSRLDSCSKQELVHT
jgi:hypothetical protein